MTRLNQNTMPAEELRTIHSLFEGERLTQARELRGYLKRDVAARVGVTPAAIGQYERGAARPAIAVIARLALALSVPAAFFAGDRSKVTAFENRTHFRSLRSTLKRERDMALSRLELVAEITRILERHVRFPLVDFEAGGVEGENIDDKALSVRLAWGLGSGPIADMVRVVELHGAIVVRLGNEIRRVDAFSCWLERPYIVLSEMKMDYYRSRFDVAHELGHILLHHDAEPGDAALERQANRFAASFLMPASSLGPHLPTSVDWREYIILKRQWGVSLAALVRRARDVSVLSDSSYKRAVVQMSSLGWREHEPGDDRTPESPTALRKALTLVLDRGDADLDLIAADARLRREEVLEIVGETRDIGPPILAL